jgi:hypothetical protein
MNLRRHLSQQLRPMFGTGFVIKYCVAHELSPIEDAFPVRFPDLGRRVRTVRGFDGPQIPNHGRLVK